MKDSLKKDREIVGILQRTWHAFFENFGRLTEVQRESIIPIFQGENVLICSATASGKTEAVCAPLIERFIDITIPWTILYISPTRALVNDLYERLYTPLKRLNLSLVRRTGDHTTMLNRIPHVLITTPESFDSIICRGRLKDNAYGHVLAMVKAVVLDEIHLLYGTPRGEQVKWLIERLRRLKKQALQEGWCKNPKVQIVGLSATVTEPKNVIRHFMDEGREIVVPGKREIVIVSDEIKPVEDSLKHYVKKLEKSEKILVFSNFRKRVDNLAASMKEFFSEYGFEVAAHHGSLSKRVREETEKAVKTHDRIVVFSTSTLEIGIDIGNIDLIVIDEPAPDIPALLQRIGRGNRRTNLTKVLLCADTSADAIIQKAMIQAAMEGWLNTNCSGPNYSVAMQQIASYIFQSPKRSRKRSSIENLIETCSSPELAETLVECMKQHEEIIEDESGIRLGNFWINMTANGQIHSNIQSTGGYNVIDEGNGGLIAKGISFAKGKGLKTGGQLLEIRQFKDFNIEVKKVKDERLAHGQWGYFTKKRFKDASQANALRRYLGLEEIDWPVVRKNGYLYVFHLGGAIRQTIIEAMANMSSKDSFIKESNQFFLTLLDNNLEKPNWLQELKPANFEIFINNEIDWFERKLCRPLSNKKLPLFIRVNEVKEWLNLDIEMCLIKNSFWKFNNNERVLNTLSCFIG